MKEKKWPVVSACHTGRLAGYRTSVGSLKTIYRFSITSLFIVETLAVTLSALPSRRDY